jgi:hypothetical protein
MHDVTALVVQDDEHELSSSLPAGAGSSCLSCARQFPNRFSGNRCSSQYSR